MLADVVTIGAVVMASAVLIDAGVVCSNDGSHYALVRAIGDHGSFVIDDYVAYTRDVDISEFGGHFFTDRPPGTAFLAVPFYWVSRLVSADPRAWEFGASLLSGVAAWIACAAAYWLARALGASREGGLALAITLGIATPLRSYGSTLFHHAVAAALVSSIAVLTVAHARDPQRWHRVLGGLLAGYACSVDYTSCLATGVLLLGMLALPAQLRAPRSGLVKAVLEVTAAGIVGLVPLLAYDTACYGHPLELGYDHQVHFSMMHSMSGIYGGSMPDGLFGLFVHPRAGLLFWSPVLWLAVAFLPVLARGERRREALVLGLAIVPFVLLMSRYYEVGAGASRDARYITPIVPLFALPIAFAWDRALARVSTEGGRKAGLLALFVVLLALSVELQIIKHLARWVRDGEWWLPRFGASAAAGDVGPTVIDFLGWAFPHPIAAIVVLAAGLAAAEWIRRAHAPTAAI
jgi:4-amino-4-deoxy-L-arabinose transferase-like glycosyltransferase